MEEVLVSLVSCLLDEVDEFFVLDLFGMKVSFGLFLESIINGFCCLSRFSNSSIVVS